jgi:hypothetical protein
MSMRNCVELKRLALLLHELGRGHADAPAALLYRHFRAFDANTEGDGQRPWYDAAGALLGRFDVVEGWRIVEGMQGGCYCDKSPADCVVARHCWTRHERS